VEATEVRLRPGARRLLDVGVRAAHLLAVGMYVGGIAWHAPAPKVRNWRALTIASGTALLVVEASASPHWPHQCRGLTTIAHAALLAPAHHWPGRAFPAAVTALLIGAVGSHLPRSVRKWSLLRRRVMP